MTEPRAAEIPRAVHEAAEDWVVALQATSDPKLIGEHADWLAASDQHRRAYAAAAETWRDGLLLRDSDEGRDRALVKAPILMRQTTHRAFAAVGVAGLAIVAAIGIDRFQPFSPVAQASAEPIHARHGEIRTVRLRDGTGVTLDSDTAISVRLSSAERRIDLLSGRIRVTPAPGLVPFVVAIGKATVASRSATFDASLLGRTPVVGVLDGAVTVDQGSGLLRRPAVRTGMALALDRAGADRPVLASDRAWPTGMLNADGLPLGDAVAALNRYNERRIVLADATLAKLALTGAFRVSDPNGFVEALVAMFGVTAERSGGDIVIRREKSLPKESDKRTGG